MFGADQWLDHNLNGTVETSSGDHAFPICVTRSGAEDAYVHLQPTVTIDAPSLSGQVLVRADGSLDGSLGNYVFHLTQQGDATYANGQITATLRSDAIPYTAQVDTLRLTWSISTDGGVTWTNEGVTSNRMYVTWDDPTNVPFETCLSIGCAAIGDAATNLDAINNIFNDGFAPLNVTRADGTPLQYYGSKLTTNVFTDQLIAAGDGQCGSWAHLLIDVLKSQGVYTNLGGASPSYVDDYDFVQAGDGADILVKNWTFPAGAVPADGFIDVPTPRLIDPATNAYEFQSTPQVAPGVGILGQNSSNPASWFNNHQIVHIRYVDSNGSTIDKYLDPSYGKAYDNMEDMEVKAVAGYSYNAVVNEQTVGLDLDGDGLIENKLVLVKRIFPNVLPNGTSRDNLFVSDQETY